MKKLCTFLSAALLASSGYAQTILQQDFESATIPALPAGWTQQTKAATGWKTGSGTVVSNNGAWTLQPHTQYAIIDDWNHDENNDSTVLISPSFSLTGKTNVYLVYDLYYVGAFWNGGNNEIAFLKASTDGGLNWNIVDTLKGAASTWQSKSIRLTAYEGMANVQIAFWYDDNATNVASPKQLPGIAVDNIRVMVPAANDASLDGITLPKLSVTDKIATSGTIVKATVKNMGLTNITSIDAQYSVDGGPAVTQTFSGLSIPFFTTSEVSFTTPLSSIAAGNHNINVNITAVNAGADANTADNQMTAPFIGSSKSVTRAGLIEEFSSSTCVPCANFNVTFDPLIVSNNSNKPWSNFNVIKYQMNWPSPGNDASYNPHGVSRQNYYGVNAIPDHFTNGMAGAGGDQTEIDASKADPAFMDLDGTYYVGTDSVFVTASATPYFNLPTANYKVYVALVENDYYNYKATTTQLYYVDVMRKMLPDGNGNAVSSWTDNTPVNYNFKLPFTVGNVAQGNFNFWTHPKNSSLVIFVQDVASKTILQSKVVEASFVTGVAQTAGNMHEFTMFPNPAKDVAYLAFTLDEAAKVKIQVIDAVGRVVTTVADQQYAKGEQQMSINTASLSAGIYTIKLSTEKGTLTHQLSVVK